MVRCLGALLILLAGVAGSPHVVQAWQCAGPSLVVWPRDGAVDVPLDSVILLEGQTELGPVTLRDTSLHEEVAVTEEVLDAAAGLRLLRPVLPLRPSSDHEISFGASRASLFFTTGTAERAARYSPASLRSVEAGIWLYPDANACCRTWSWTHADASQAVDDPARGAYLCVELEAASNLLALAIAISPRDPDEPELRTYLGGPFAGGTKYCGTMAPWLEAGARYDVRLISYDGSWGASADDRVLPLEVAACVGDDCTPCSDEPPAGAPPIDTLLAGDVRGGGCTAVGLPAPKALGLCAAAAALVTLLVARRRTARL